jgi:hypothetical protein
MTLERLDRSEDYVLHLVILLLHTEYVYPSYDARQIRQVF